jgi:tetratricopeptide (TPR) repeat protein
MDLLRRGRIEEAHGLADRIVAQNPTLGYSLHAVISFWGEGDLMNSLSWGLRASPGNGYASMALGNVGEYDEARRMSGDGAYWLHATQGQWDEAVRVSQEVLRTRPDSAIMRSDVAEVLYRAGRFDEARALYERALELSPAKRPIRVSDWEPYYMIQLAVARRKTGDEKGALEAAGTIRERVARQVAEGSYQRYDLNAAMLAAFDNEPVGAIAALKSAVRRGLSWKVFLDDPVFEDLQDEPGFVAVRQELDENLAREHEKILQLICFDNPVPDEWQPLPETCEGVVEHNGI